MITTHVLDTARGRPAVGLRISLAKVTGGGVELVGEGVTDEDGRQGRLGSGPLTAGRYRLTFSTGRWFADEGLEGFYPQVVIEFAVASPDQHYHVPLLLSPFGYSTYRGS